MISEKTKRHGVRYSLNGRAPFAEVVKLSVAEAQKKVDDFLREPLTQSFVAAWKGRMTVSTCNDPEGLSILPPIPENTVDKSCLYRDMCNNTMTNTTVIVGFYDVPGYGPDSVETEVTGRPAAQYAELDRLIRNRHPLASPVHMRRVGSIVEQREGAEGSFIEVPPGATIGQLFANLETGEAELSRTVGRVFMFGSPHDVVLVSLRAQGYVQVRLTPLLKGAGNAATTYSNRLDPQRLADELPLLIKDVIGADARDLKLKFREVNPKPLIA